MEHSFPLQDIENILFEFAEKAKQQDVVWLKTQFKFFVEGYREGSDKDGEVEKVDTTLKDEMG